MRFALDDSDDSTETEEAASVRNIKTQTGPMVDASLVDSMASLRIPGAWPKSFVAAGAPQRCHSKHRRKSSFHRHHSLRHKSASSCKLDGTARHRKTPATTQPKATRRPFSKKATGGSAPRQPHSTYQRPFPNAPSPPPADTDYIRRKHQAQEASVAAADRLAERLRARAQQPGIFDYHETAPPHKRTPPSAAKNPHMDHGGHYRRTAGVPNHENATRFAQEQARAAREKASRAKMGQFREERERIIREQERIEREQMAERARVEEARRQRTEAWARQQRAAFLKHKQATLTQQRKLDPWTLYERAWKTISSPQTSPPTIRLGEIPWPIKRPRGHPHGEVLPLWFLSMDNIRSFLLTPDHFVGKSTRLRLREALLIWHPDKFESRIKAKVPPEEWERVFEGCQTVIRVLNDPKLVEGLE